MFLQPPTGALGPTRHFTPDKRGNTQNRRGRGPQSPAAQKCPPASARATQAPKREPERPQAPTQAPARRSPKRGPPHAAQAPAENPHAAPAPTANPPHSRRLKTRAPHRRKARSGSKCAWEARRNAGMHSVEAPMDRSCGRCLPSAFRVDPRHRRPQGAPQPFAPLPRHSRHPKPFAPSQATRAHPQARPAREAWPTTAVPLLVPALHSPALHS